LTLVVILQRTKTTVKNVPFGSKKKNSNALEGRFSERGRSLLF
jgi:hypothetical protein